MYNEAEALYKILKSNKNIKVSFDYMPDELHSRQYTKAYTMVLKALSKVCLFQIIVITAYFNSFGIFSAEEIAATVQLFESRLLNKGDFCTGT